uniref:Uncharacterized protein n=1 Tax=Gopherus evgoodei TaxID=1825980 RepID=A0A8C4VP73_9SAUR
QLGVMAQDAQVRAEMSTLGPPAEGQPESPSLYRWLAEAVGAAYPSVGELEALVSPWKTISEGIQALRQLGMAWAVSTGGTEGPEDMLVSKSTKAAFIRTAPDELKPSLLAVVMVADGRVGELAATLMQLGTALAGAQPKAVRAAKDLLQAGVPQEDIYGQPTPHLAGVEARRDVAHDSRLPGIEQGDPPTDGHSARHGYLGRARCGPAVACCVGFG